MTAFIADLGKTPARINRINGNLYLNKTFFQLPKNQQNFIIQHELGHYYLNTSNEILADNYAFQNYAGTEKKSLKGILHAIADNLDIENNPSHAIRYKNIANKLIAYDIKHNNNTKLKQMVAQDILPEKTKKALWKQLIVFLENQGISSVSTLPLKQRQELLYQFFAQKTTLDELQKAHEENIADESSFLDNLFGNDDSEPDTDTATNDDKQKSGVFRQLFGGASTTFAPTLGAGIAAIGSALGVPIPPEVGATLFTTLGTNMTSRGQQDMDTYMQDSKGKTQDNINATADIDNSDKKKKIIIGGSIAGGVLLLTIILVLIFTR